MLDLGFGMEMGKTTLKSLHSSNPGYLDMGFLPEQHTSEWTHATSSGFAAITAKTGAEARRSPAVAPSISPSSLVGHPPPAKEEATVVMLIQSL
jgi:hypothetical protein